VVTAHAQIVAMAPTRTTVSKTLRPGIARMQQMSQTPTTMPFSQQPYQSEIGKKSFSTQEPSSRWSNLLYGKQPSIAEQKRDSLNKYRIKNSPDTRVGKEQAVELPTPQELEESLKQALNEKNARKIVEGSELAMAYMLNGYLNIENFEAMAKKAIEEIDFDDHLASLKYKASALTGMVLSWPIKMPLYFDLSQALFTILQSEVMGGLIGMGFYATARGIKRAYLGNARAAAQELLKITTKAQEILNEQDNQKSYEDVD
jgi:hypothetical protein